MFAGPGQAAHRSGAVGAMPQGSTQPSLSECLDERVETRALLVREWVIGIAGVRVVGVERRDLKARCGSYEREDSRKLRFDRSHPAHSGINFQMCDDVAFLGHA